MEHLREVQLVIVLGEGNEITDTFDHETEGVQSIDTKGYSGMDATIHYVVKDGLPKWVFYSDEFETFLCCKDLWVKLDLKICASDSSPQIEDRYDEIREIVKALAKHRLGIETGKVSSIMPEYFQTQQVQTYLERAIIPHLFYTKK